jgi:hypothetical protein
MSSTLENVDNSQFGSTKLQISGETSTQTSGLPWWVWVLIGLAVIGTIVGIVIAVNNSKSKTTNPESCASPKTLVDGVCKCPDGFITTERGCITCPENQVLVNGECSCPNFQILDGNNCKSCDNNSRYDLPTKSCIPCKAGEVKATDQISCEIPNLFSNPLRNKVRFYTVINGEKMYMSNTSNVLTLYPTRDAPSNSSNEWYATFTGSKVVFESVLPTIADGTIAAGKPLYVTNCRGGMSRYTLDSTYSSLLQMVTTQQDTADTPPVLDYTKIKAFTGVMIVSNCGKVEEVYNSPTTFDSDGKTYSLGRQPDYYTQCGISNDDVKCKYGVTVIRGIPIITGAYMTGFYKPEAMGGKGATSSTNALYNSATIDTTTTPPTATSIVVGDYTMVGGLGYILGKPSFYKKNTFKADNYGVPTDSFKDNEPFASNYWYFELV